jgi:hypothetical protein
MHVDALDRWYGMHVRGYTETGRNNQRGAVHLAQGSWLASATRSCA